MSLPESRAEAKERMMGRTKFHRRGAGGPSRVPNTSRSTSKNVELFRIISSTGDLIQAVDDDINDHISKLTTGMPEIQNTLSKLNKMTGLPDLETGLFSALQWNR